MGKTANRHDEYDITNPPHLDFSGMDGDMKFTRSDFLRMAEPDIGGAINFNLFGGWLKIDGDGLYVNTDHERIVGLTNIEAADLSVHPTGNTKEPALKFPFTLKELIEFLEFTNEEGWDFPISHERFYNIVANKQNKARTEAIKTAKKPETALSQPVQDAQKKHGGLEKFNMERKALHQEMRDIAKDIWEKHEDSQYRVTDVSEMIHRHLTCKNTKNVPQIDTIKKKIRSVAPAYAKQPGRKNKT
ncbi:hypothetical protein [Dickeya chrysanthemi]|uniref:hypothetical protein n=1 Tax=Dickeya chrysanthemi TaxID=556 RepID=UPI000482879A|nr:hypothetical protein [Dickeya chrysanthemi]